jgi:hypothetical protein
MNHCFQAFPVAFQQAGARKYSPIIVHKMRHTVCDALFCLLCYGDAFITSGTIAGIAALRLIALLAHRFRGPTFPDALAINCEFVTAFAMNGLPIE